LCLLLCVVVFFCVCVCVLCCWCCCLCFCVFSAVVDRVSPVISVRTVDFGAFRGLGRRRIGTPILAAMMIFLPQGFGTIETKSGWKPDERCMQFRTHSTPDLGQQQLAEQPLVSMRAQLQCGGRVASITQTYIAAKVSRENLLH